MPRGRRRRRRHSANPSAAALLAGVAPPEPVPPAAGPSPAPLASTHEPQGSPEGEQVWERTHLEQTMFTLARENAEAAARCSRAAPPNREGEQTHSLVSMLMSFLSLEAFINMVGGDRLGSRYRHYDRMSPEGKWMEVTRLASKTGKTFDEDGEELRALSMLRTWRNMLTHYKGEYEEVQQAGRGGETKVEALLSSENAARAVEIARTLYRRFYEMDRRSPPRQFIWLDDRPHRPRSPGEAGPVTPSRRPEAVSAGGPRKSPEPPKAPEGASRPPRRRRRRR